MQCDASIACCISVFTATGMYAAAIAGQRGVEHAIALLRDEIDRNMAMIGATSIEEIDFDIRV